MTHISKGPIASAYQLQDTRILTVFSHHFIRRDGQDSLLAFFGAGDSQSCWSEIDVSSVCGAPGNRRNVNISNPDNHNYHL